MVFIKRFGGDFDEVTWTSVSIMASESSRLTEIETTTMSLSKLKCPRFHPHLMPVQLQAVVQPRLASTASTAHYPYPSHRHPKPHEIFHLPLSASQAEIKSRCAYRCNAC